MHRPTKITFADMRAQGVRGLLVYCADYRCSHSLAISGDRWPDDLRLSDIEPRFICAACGHRGADVRPDFNWNKIAVRTMGYSVMSIATLLFSKCDALPAVDGLQALVRVAARGR